MVTDAAVDAVIVGSGPNGLAAAITLGRAGWRVRVVEGHATVGGGMRTLPLTAPGFQHDICSAVHPLGMGSPFFQKVDLAQHPPVRQNILGLAGKRLWCHRCPEDARHADALIGA